MIKNMTLVEYLTSVSKRLPEEADKVLNVLVTEGHMNKEELSLVSRVKRAVLDHVIMQLYALGLVDVYSEGKSKICSLTTLGEEYHDVVRKTEAV